MSGNGPYVVFNSDSPNVVRHDTNHTADVFVHDRTRDVTTRVSVGARGRQANGPSGGPATSATGRYDAFSSSASTLLIGAAARVSGVSVRGLRRGRTRRE